MDNDFRQIAATAGIAEGGAGLLGSPDRMEKHRCLMDAISGIDSVLIQLSALEERIATPMPKNETEEVPEPDCSTLEAVLHNAPAIISGKSEKALQLIQSIQARLF